MSKAGRWGELIHDLARGAAYFAMCLAVGLAAGDLLVLPSSHLRSKEPGENIQHPRVNVADLVQHAFDEAAESGEPFSISTYARDEVIPPELFSMRLRDDVQLDSDAKCPDADSIRWGRETMVISVGHHYTVTPGFSVVIGSAAVQCSFDFPWIVVETDWGKQR